MTRRLFKRFGPVLAAGLLLAAAPLGAQDLPGQAPAVAQPPAPGAPLAAGPARGAAPTPAERLAPPAGPPAGQRFVMVASPSAAAAQLSLFSSADGHTYTTLASETWQPPQGPLHDPALLRSDDGQFLLAYTGGPSGRRLGLARSRDLRHWQPLAELPLALPGRGEAQAWAPEWFRDSDGRISLLVSLSGGGAPAQAPAPLRRYRLQPTAADFSAFGPPRLLQGLDRAPADTALLRQGGRYLALALNAATQQIERAWAPALEGPWTYDRTGDWAGWGGPVASPALAPIADAQGRPGWRLQWEDPSHRRSHFSDSFDGLATWTPRRELGGVSGAVQQAGVLAEDAARLQQATAPQSPAQAITWDRQSLMFNGRREMVWAGEFHPFRLPSPSLWRDVLQKMKAIGFNAVSVYFSWGYHSAAPGQYDFSGVRNVERVLQMAAEEGLYVIARPGPYVNGELAGGGFPGWLQRQRAEARTDAPEYQNAAGEWLTQINAIIARHQLSNGGGTVIAYQLENELFSVQPKNARHMQFLADKARADGITVPLFHNAASRLPDWTPRGSSAPFANPGPTDLYAFDGYPGGVCGVDATPGAPAAAPDWGFYGQNLPKVGALASPNTPGFVAEIGGGWFDYWGSNGTYDCTAQRQGTGYQRVFYGRNLANGIAIHSVYMAFGGTSWGWQPAPVVFSSYDYGAAIDEARRLRPKAYGLKLMGLGVQAATPVLASMAPGPVVQADNPRVQLLHNLSAATGAQLLYAAQQPSSATGHEAFRFALTTADGHYQVPQAGQLQLKGQDAKLLLAAYPLARQHLVYATSELMTQLRLGERDLALLHGRHGEDGETVLRYRQRPTVQVLAGPGGAAADQAVAVQWDAARGDLRLNYRHQGLLELLVSGGGRPPLLLLLADEATAQQFWRLDLDPRVAARADADGHAVLALSPALLRGARRDGAQLLLQGDTLADSPLRVWAAPGVQALRFNGEPLALQAAAGDSLLARQPLPGPLPVALPQLDQLPWLRRADSPEARPDFDDHDWRRAEDARVSASHVYTAPDKGQPVLAMSDHGFHRGDVWYRGRFASGPGTPAGSGPLNLALFYGAGGAGLIQVWLDGRFLGQHELDTGRPFPETTDTLHLTLADLPPGEHVLALVVRNMGHNWDLFADDAHKEARGLIAASLSPRGGRRFAVPIAWRLQGSRGGEILPDLVRGPYNNGGLFGEREGWHLPLPADAGPEHPLRAGWAPARPTDAPPAPGTYWLRSQFRLALPAGHDLQLGLAFGDTDAPRTAAAQRVLVFVNGWQMGQYISHVGPQRVFVLPPGVLRPDGENTLALAVTTDGQPENALVPFRLVVLQAARGGVPLQPVAAPALLQRPPAAPEPLAPPSPRLAP